MSLSKINLQSKIIYSKIKNNPIFDTLKHSKNYFIANLFTVGISFLTLPIFTRLMSVEEIGIYSVFMAFTGFAMVFLGLNLYSSVSRYYFENKEDFDSFIGMTIILTSLVIVVTIIIFVTFQGFFNNLLNLPEPLGLYLIILAIFLILDSIYSQILIAKKQSVKYVTISISKFSLILFFSIILVYIIPENKYLGRIWPILGINFFFSIFFISKLIKISKFSLKMEHLKYIVFYTIPLIPYVLSSVILSFFDRVFINATSGPADSGLYSIGYTIAALIALGISSLHAAQTPEFFKLMNSKDYNKYFLLASRLFSILVLLALGLILFSRNILEIMTDPKFHSSYQVILPVVIGYLFYGLFFVYGQYIGYVKKTGYLSIALILSSIINIILNVTLIPTYGYVAGAYATLISYFFLFLFSWIISKFILNQHVVPILLVMRPLIILFAVLSYYFIIENFILDFLFSVSLKIIIILIFVIITFFKDLKKVFF